MSSLTKQEMILVLDSALKDMGEEARKLGLDVLLEFRADEEAAMQLAIWNTLCHKARALRDELILSMEMSGDGPGLATAHLWPDQGGSDEG